MPDRRRVSDLSSDELLKAYFLRVRGKNISRFSEASQIIDANEGHASAMKRPTFPSDGNQKNLNVESFFFDAKGLPPLTYKNDRNKQPRERFLLAVEYLAVAGLLSILIFTFFNVRALNRQIREEQALLVSELPTAQPTPLLRVVVLPGGHTPPTAPQGASPNYDEVPSSLRPIVEQQFAGPVIIPTPGPTNAIRIKIPAIGVDATVVQGDGWDQLKKGVAQHLGTPDPGQVGNIVLSAHNDIYGEIFRQLDRLAPGDEIILFTQTAEFVYRVVETKVVSPTSVEVLNQGNIKQVTLISCYPYLVNTDRIVVVGELSG